MTGPLEYANRQFTTVGPSIELERTRIEEGSLLPPIPPPEWIEKFLYVLVYVDESYAGSFPDERQVSEPA